MKTAPHRLLFLLVLSSLVVLLAGWDHGQALAPATEVQLHNDDGAATSYTAGLFQANIVGAVLRAEDANYPLAVQAVQSWLYLFDGAIASVRVRAVIYSVGANGRPATLLGASQPVTLTTFYPQEINIPLSTPVTLNSPQAFLAGIEYLSGDKGTTPSALFDDNTNIPTGKNYFSEDGGATWIEHYGFWRDPASVGYAMVRATVSIHVAPVTGTPATATPTPTLTPSPTLSVTPTPSPYALWPGFPIGYGKQHGMVKDIHGRVHMVYFGTDQRSLYHAWSDDGVHWQPPLTERVPFYIFAEPGGGGSLALDADGESLHLLIGQDLSTTHPGGGINGALYFQYRQGHWQGGEKVAAYGYGYNLAVDAAGGVHAVWSDRDVWYRYRTPEGVWEPERILAYNGWYPDIDIGPDGVLHVAFNGNGLCCDATWVEVYYLQSRDGGATWSPAERLTYDQRWSGSASGGVDDHGVYHLLYLQKGATEGDLYYTTRALDGSWSSPQRLMRGVTTGQTGAESAAIGVDAAGDIAAVFYCNLAGDTRTVCLVSRDAQVGWGDVRYLAIISGLAFSHSIAGGVFDMGHIDVTWGAAHQIFYRRIEDIVLTPTRTLTPTPTATPKPYHVRVQDDSGQPMSGALVYRNGVFAGRTRNDGILDFDALREGDELITLAPLPLDISRVPGSTHRSQHDRDIAGDDPVEPWAFRVYLSNMRQSPDLGPQSPPLLSSDEPGERSITVYRNSPLILLNLVASIEWDADEAYLRDLQQGFQAASRFLYDISDGQMALGRVVIFDKAQHWADADIRIAANNQIFPHAAVDGVSASRHDFNVRLGPLWNGNSAHLKANEDGLWSHAPGWQTIVHELGHYILGLYDEYVHFIEIGGVPAEEDAYCTHQSADPNAPLGPNRASIMDNEHLATELADNTLSLLWSDACTHTEQWDRSGGKSDWQTLLDRFSPAGNGAPQACRPGNVPAGAYCLWTPGSRGQVIPQPTPDYPTRHDWPLPRIDILADLQGPPRRHLQVQWQNQPPGSNPLALRAVVEQEIDGERTYLEQGYVSAYSGESDLFGVYPGAILHLNTADRSVQTSVPLSDTVDIHLVLVYPNGLSTQASVPAPALTLAPQADGRGLVVTLVHAPDSASQVAFVSADAAPQYFPLGREGDTASAVLPLDFRYRVGGSVRVLDAGGQPLRPELAARFWGRGLAAPAPADIFSPDGRLRLHIPEGALMQDTFVVVSELGAAPGVWPQNWAALGPVYEVRYPDGHSVPAARLQLRPDPAQSQAFGLGHISLLSSAMAGADWHELTGIEPLAERQGYSAPWKEGYVVVVGQGAVDVYLPLISQ